MLTDKYSNSIRKNGLIQLTSGAAIGSGINKTDLQRIAVYIEKEKRTIISIFLVKLDRLAFTKVEQRFGHFVSLIRIFLMYYTELE
jgi:hypothetical protein